MHLFYTLQFYTAWKIYKLDYKLDTRLETIVDIYNKSGLPEELLWEIVEQISKRNA